MDMSKQLVDELVELWVETKIQCDKIESLVKQIKKRQRNSWFFKEEIVMNIEDEVNQNANHRGTL